MSEPVGDMLYRIRKEKRFTIVDRAEKISVSQAYISKLELGQIEPTKVGRCSIKSEDLEKFIETRSNK